jgi:hypothetical protein
MKVPLTLTEINIRILVVNNPADAEMVRLEGAVYLETAERGPLHTGFVTTPFTPAEATELVPIAIEAIGRLVTNPNSEFVEEAETPQVIRIAMMNPALN